MCIRCSHTTHIHVYIVNKAISSKIVYHLNELYNERIAYNCLRYIHISTNKLTHFGLKSIGAVICYVYHLPVRTNQVTALVNGWPWAIG